MGILKLSKKFWCIALAMFIITSTVFAAPSRYISYDYRKSPDVDLQNKLNRAIKEIIQKNNIPGAVVGIWSEQHGIWIKAFGKADVFEGKEMKNSYKFRIANITETFIAVILAQLADERKINLDDRLIKYIPAVPNADKITIRQLLNHTSGIFDYAEDKDFWPKVLNDPLKQWPPQELINIALSHPFYFAPGSAWHYSNTNYILLGMIIEQVTGNKLQNELARRILEPLELKKTTFSTESFMVGDYSQGYIEHNNGAKLQDLTLLDPSIAWASGAMISNLEDLAIWAKAELKERFTSDRLKNERFKWIATGEPRLSYGLGVAKLGNFIGHDGQIPGYSSAMFYLPSRDITIIVLVNKSDDNNLATLLFKEIAKILVPIEAPWRLDRK